MAPCLASLALFTGDYFKCGYVLRVLALLAHLNHRKDGQVANHWSIQGNAHVPGSLVSDNCLHAQCLGNKLHSQERFVEVDCADWLILWSDIVPLSVVVRHNNLLISGLQRRI